MQPCPLQVQAGKQTWHVMCSCIQMQWKAQGSHCKKIQIVQQLVCWHNQIHKHLDVALIQYIWLRFGMVAQTWAKSEPYVLPYTFNRVCFVFSWLTYSFVKMLNNFLSTWQLCGKRLLLFIYFFLIFLNLSAPLFLFLFILIESQLLLLDLGHIWTI